MQNTDLGDVERDEALEALPGQARTLAAPSQSTHPSPADFGAEHSEPFQIAGKRVILTFRAADLLGRRVIGYPAR